MSNSAGQKHKNYEILNLIGYGLAKFDAEFVNRFGFASKTAFYNYCVNLGLAETPGVIKNRMDLFDHFFDNNRRGWWQKGDAYIHRKIKIDVLFGGESAAGYVNIVKFYLKDNFNAADLIARETPIIKSRFKQLQETGLEAELFFYKNFGEFDLFKGGQIEDARLYGDGYDFQINVNDQFFLAEVKGIRGGAGRFRMTNNEYNQAKKHGDNYVLSAVFNLEEIPKIKLIQNPLETVAFRKITSTPKPQIEYQSVSSISCR